MAQGRGIPILLCGSLVCLLGTLADRGVGQAAFMGLYGTSAAMFFAYTFIRGAPSLPVKILDSVLIFLFIGAMPMGHDLSYRTSTAVALALRTAAALYTAARQEKTSRGPS
jgi:hypothetical protein